MEEINLKIKNKTITTEDKELIKKLDEQARFFNENLIRLVVVKPGDLDITKITKTAESKLLGLATELVSGLPDDKKKV
jgi:hypothetical protein